MHFLVQIDTDEDWTRVVAWANSEFQAIKKGKDYCRENDIVWEDVSAEMFNTFEHGDVVNYECI